MQSAVIIAAIALAVFLGYKTKRQQYGFLLHCICIFYRLFLAGSQAESSDCILADEHDVRHHLRFVVL